MAEIITINGNKTELAWTKASSRLMRLRLSGIGFDWDKDLNQRRMGATMVKICWSLLPSEIFNKYASHEEMYLAMTDEEDVEMFQAVGKVIDEMTANAEKKSILTNSPLPE